MSRSRTRRGRILAALAAGVAAALLCAACSSSSNSGSTAASSGKVVHIFAWGQETAPALGALYPSETWMQGAPEAAVKAVNSDPGSKVKLTFTFCDSKLTPNGSATCAQQALSPAGCNGSPCTVAVDELDLNETIAVAALHARGLPVVAPTPSSVQVLGTPGVFCLTGTSQAAEPGLGYLLQAAGVHKVGIVGVQLPETTAIDQWIEQGIRDQGLTLNGVQNPAETDPNMQPPVTAVMASFTAAPTPGPPSNTCAARTRTRQSRCRPTSLLPPPCRASRPRPRTGSRSRRTSSRSRRCKCRGYGNT